MLEAVPRGESAREVLEIAWTYPVYSVEQQAAAGETVAARRKAALPLEEAFAYLSGDDHRPLLILRECLVCNGTDEALLKSEGDNERTILMMRWFHCVKLPVDVMLEEDHPFHALFDGKSPPHLVVCDFDGANLRPLESERSRTELWDVLGQAIERNYRGDPRKALKEMVELLDEYDLADRELAKLQGELEETIETKGPESSKARKLAQKIERAESRLKALDARFAKTSELERIERQAVPAEAPPAGP